MKAAYCLALAVPALALAWALAGCGRGDQATTSPPSPAGSGTAVTAAALGTESAAGPFRVTLSTEPAAPKVGETRFEVTVTKDGQPVKDAAVTINLSMPSMQMMGPEATLKPGTEDYEGSANLSMGGEWEAKVTVSAGAESGTTVFRFSASQ